MGCCSCLHKNQSIKIASYTNKRIEHGPGMVCHAPWHSTEKFDKITLGANEYLIILNNVSQADTDIIEHIGGPLIFQQNNAYSTISGPHKKVELSNLSYVVVTNTKTGTKKVVGGPQFYMPQPFETLSGILSKLSLHNNDYCIVTDNLTGKIKIISGPTIYTPSEFESASSILKKTELSTTQYIICTDGKTGEKTIIEGPLLYTPKEYEKISEIIEKVNLKNNQYCYVKDLKTGIVKTVEGPKVFALTPFEIVTTGVQNCITMTFKQYIFVKDVISGLIKIERGPSKILLTQNEIIVPGKRGEEIREAITVDAHHAIHIRDIVKGTEELITQPQLYFPPNTNIDIIKVVDITMLAPYEKMVIVDKDCNLIFKSGETTPNFFLPPFCKVYSQNWTINGAQKEITKFDCRFHVHDMSFNFSVRTNDNVEITMIVNIYWAIKEFEKMIKATDNPPQDICSQISSQILNISSKLSTKELMEYSSMDIVQKVIDEDSEFFLARGVQILRINIVEKKCTNPEVDKTYRAVIEEKINRVKILEQQRGENDKNLALIEGQISFEAENYKLLEKKLACISLENGVNGKAEGQRLNMFFESLGKGLSNDEKMKIFMELQRTERIKRACSA